MVVRMVTLEVRNLAGSGGSKLFCSLVVAKACVGEEWNYLGENNLYQICSPVAKRNRGTLFADRPVGRPGRSGGVAGVPGRQPAAARGGAERSVTRPAYCGRCRGGDFGRGVTGTMARSSQRGRQHPRRHHGENVLRKWSHHQPEEEEHKQLTITIRSYCQAHHLMFLGEVHI